MSGALSNVELLKRAAEAMVAEAGRLERMDREAVEAPWLAFGEDVVVRIKKCTCASLGVGYPHEMHCGVEPVGGPFGSTPEGEWPDVDLIAHRRNSTGRDAVTLRALARAMTELAALVHAKSPLEPLDHAVIATARAFLGG